MAALKDLRQKVQIRIRDFAEIPQFDPIEINQAINEAQDHFTANTKYLKLTDQQNIVANTAKYTVNTPSNTRLGEILTVKINNGSSDLLPLQVMSPLQMDYQFANWRNTKASIPSYYVVNFDPTLAGELTVTTNSVWLYPTPDTGYTNGLVVTYSYSTDNALTADNSTLVINERVCEEAIIDYAVSELLLRSSNDAWQIYRGRYETALNKARRESEIKYRSRPRTRAYFF
jgi:hypothetical protein